MSKRGAWTGNSANSARGDGETRRLGGTCPSSRHSVPWGGCGRSLRAFAMTVLTLTDCEWSWESASPEESLRAGEGLGRLLHPGDLVALFGELGSGKTLFVRGVAAGLGCAPEDVHSPSFTLVNEYACAHAEFGVAPRPHRPLSNAIGGRGAGHRVGRVRRSRATWSPWSGRSGHWATFRRTTCAFGWRFGESIDDGSARRRRVLDPRGSCGTGSRPWACGWTQYRRTTCLFLSGFPREAPTRSSHDNRGDFPGNGEWWVRGRGGRRESVGLCIRGSRNPAPRRSGPRCVRGEDHRRGGPAPVPVGAFRRGEAPLPHVHRSRLLLRLPKRATWSRPGGAGRSFSAT